MDDRAELYDALLAEELRKPVEYFKHDVSAHDDDALLSLVYEHGMAYYGLYWLLAEKLYERKSHMYDLGEPAEAHRLAADLGSMHPISREDALAFVQRLAEHGLIDREVFAESGRVIMARVAENVRQVAEMKASRRLGGAMRRRD